MMTPAQLDKIARNILLMLGHLIRERAHAQIVITVREGEIQLIDERRTYLPQNLPEN